MFCRRHWAQCITKFRIVLLRTVDLPSDMLTVSDATGNLALGLSAGGAPGVVGFTINVQRFDGTNFGPINVPPVTVLPGATPDATANLIKAAIEQTPGLTATVSVNPAEVGDPRGSADILIRDAGGGRITITNLTAQAQQDTQQVVAVNSVGLAFNIRNALADYHVGHPDERNLYNTFDTGASRIDIFVAQSFVGRPNLLGFTVCSQTDLNATRQPLDAVRNTIIMRQDSADGTNFQRYALPHEVGHVLLDDAMHADNSRQLMFPTLHGAVDVNDPKRLIGVDPPATNWENLVSSPDDRVITRRIRMNALSRVLDKAQGLRHF
jgi:hypothetical protein